MTDSSASSPIKSHPDVWMEKLYLLNTIACCKHDGMELSRLQFRTHKKRYNRKLIDLKPVDAISNIATQYH